MKAANRLARETSPYLLQHAHNPVDWHPWGEEAFETARRLDKPVFLSIGYSTCHWCHVMERESFEDGDVARLLNEAFVCVKVDREERPDLDQHFMAVCQALTGSGGWPLTIVMTPDKRPFFAGTYFPKSRRWGRPGLLELAPLIGEAWRTRREEVLRSAEGIIAALERGRAEGRSTAAGSPPSEDVLDDAYGELAADFDAARGGFGSAPKFPMPHQLGFLLRYGRRTGKSEAVTMATATLAAMRRGGIYDQLGYGFHRYATDADWLVPHFEKMLYDQALLAEVYAEAAVATGERGFGRTAEEIAEYVLRDLASPDGGFFAAEDADSEGEEGKFYFWTRGELEAILGPEQARAAARAYGIEVDGNFAEPGQARDGRNILHLSRTRGTPAAVTGPVLPLVDDRIGAVREKLFGARGSRVRPFKDTKVLADWNGLMIAALASVFRLAGEAEYLRAADGAADFVLERMRTRDGRLLHVYAGGQARIPAFLDDYAFLIRGLIALYEAAFDPGRLETALSLTRQVIELFGDEREGGFFFAAEPEAGSRRKEVYDGAVPSGNSVMLMNLLRLGRLTGRQELEDRASSLAAAFSGEVSLHPRASSEFLRGLDYALGPAQEIVVVGKREAADTQKLLAVLRGMYLPHSAVLFKPEDEPAAARALERLVPFTKGMDAGGGTAAAYVCSRGACLRPVRSPAELREALK